MADCRLLIVDDESLMRSALQRALRHGHYDITMAADGMDAVGILAKHSPDAFAVAIVDLRMPRMDGHALLMEIKRRSPETRVIILTGQGSISDAVRAMRSGADDFLEKPFDCEVLRERVDAARRLWLATRPSPSPSAAAGRADPFQNLVGGSVEMQRIRQMARRVGDSDATVLLQGESGTGKEQLVRAIHLCGKRATEPFVPVDLGSTSAEIIGSELFGHTKGAFTNAAAAREGLIRSAEGGTVFLDEIGELHPFHASDAAAGDSGA